MAVAGAATVTVLTVAGALGLGPGAAVAETRAPSRAAGSSASTADPGTPSDPGASDPSSDGSSGRTPGITPSDDGWLTIDDKPTDDKPTRPPRSETSTALPDGSGHGRRVVYDISAQRVWLVGTGDQVERTYLVSGGKDPKLLEPGHYEVYSKSRNAVSYNHKETMNYMVRFATGDHAPIGFHDVPARGDGQLVESRTQLGTPMSSGCIRQWITDAQALWEFTDVGTKVVVTA